MDTPKETLKKKIRLANQDFLAALSKGNPIGIRFTQNVLNAYINQLVELSKTPDCIIKEAVKNRGAMDLSFLKENNIIISADAYKKRLKQGKQLS